MSGPIRTLRFAAAALVVAGGLIVASCGGGSVNSPPVAQPTATSAPNTQSIPTSGGTLTLASSLAQVATVTFGSGVPAGVSLTASSSATAPSGSPVVSSIKRTTQSTITGAVPFFYVTFSVSANLSTALISSESVTLTSSDPLTATYGVAFDDITTSPGTELGTAGPGTIANGIVTIANGGGQGAPTLQAGHTYLMQFFYVPAASPTATPTGASPTATPTSASATATPTSAPSGATPTPIPSYTFSGGNDTTSCTTASCGAPPVYITDSALTFQATFANPTVSTEITGAVANGTAQISPSNTFPVYNNSAGGTVELYFQLSANPATVFPLTPAIQVSGLTGGVTTCFFYGYVTGSSANTWTAISPQTGPAQVIGGSVSFPAVSPGGTININPAPFYGAIVCS
jgi:hypothetical protein